ncbi:MAG: hypothetical protein ACT4PU_06050 [Planctomycetota bacterium]
MNPQDAVSPMTTEAWTFMLVTWSIVVFFTVKFFLKVLKTPPKP